MEISKAAVWACSVTKEVNTMGDYVGIDYGRGKSNIDHTTGIRYGVINQNQVLQAWADSSEPYYGTMECAVCGEGVTVEDDECPKCGADLNSQFDFIEPASFVLDDGEYLAECGDSGDVFITKSPYYTRCQFCSPCAPGAGYIMNTVEDGVKVYCFDGSFFESGIAPYPVYDVKTDEIVKGE